MSETTKKFEDTVNNVSELLNDDENIEWKESFQKYANAIRYNLGTIKLNKTKFREWTPLYLYMGVSQAGGNLEFNLRYLGQQVAELKVRKDQITISTKKFNKRNRTNFGCPIELNNSQWRSKEATNFRKYFSQSIKRSSVSNRDNEEHRIESLLLTEFSKKSTKNKIFRNIQPIKFAEIARFQMPTPLGASGKKGIKYSKSSKGGGIDILTRIGVGRSTKLCIMEVKDQNVKSEPPSKAIEQGLSYAVFIRELLRSNSGNDWWKIFGFGGSVPKNLELYVTCVMPSNNNDDISFAKQKIQYLNDCFQLHYIYFEEKNNKLINIKTSLNQ